MGAGQSDLYKATYGDIIENIPNVLKEEKEDTFYLTESAVREKYISNINNMTPTEIYNKLCEEGCEVVPLSKGNYKGIPFENGGGFKILLGKDGTFQYHPGGAHHNNGEPYYKLSTGYSGKTRYNMKGELIDD